MEWTEAQTLFIKKLRDNQNAPNWIEVAKQFNKKFNMKRTPDSVGSAYRRWKDLEFTTEGEGAVRTIRQMLNSRKTSSYNARQARLMAQALEEQGDVLERIQRIADGLNGYRHKPPKKRKDPKKFDMVMELMLSDLHFGKLIRSNGDMIFNETVARRRLREIVSVVLREITINRKHYNVDRLVVACLGDFIESYEMHLLESARGCEYGTARQVQACIESLLYDVFIPLAETGIKIDVPAVTGNHDRSSQKRTYVNPGENNWTWIIYNTLSELLKARGYKNVTFHIPSEQYVVLDIFGSKVLYEHGDLVSRNKKDIEGHISRRSRQAGEIIDFMRIGHYHSHDMDESGRVIVNLSLCGPDSFSDVHGWAGLPGQVLNFYLDYPLKRPRGQKKHTFHKTFGIKVE